MLTRQIRGDKVFLLVEISYSGFGGFFHNYLYTKKKKRSEQITKNFLFFSSPKWILSGSDKKRIIENVNSTV